MPTLDSDTKAREDRLRRIAQQQSLILVKSRQRDPEALDYGLYVLVEDTSGNRITGAQAPISGFAGGDGGTLDDIEGELTASTGT